MNQKHVVVIGLAICAVVTSSDAVQKTEESARMVVEK